MPGEENNNSGSSLFSLVPYAAAVAGATLGVLYLYSSRNNGGNLKVSGGGIDAEARQGTISSMKGVTVTRHSQFIQIASTSGGSSAIDVEVDDHSTVVNSNISAQHLLNLTQQLGQAQLSASAQQLGSMQPVAAIGQQISVSEAVKQQPVLSAAQSAPQLEAEILAQAQHSEVRQGPR